MTDTLKFRIRLVTHIVTLTMMKSTGVMSTIAIFHTHTKTQVIIGMFYIGLTASRWSNKPRFKAKKYAHFCNQMILSMASKTWSSLMKEAAQGDLLSVHPRLSKTNIKSVIIEDQAKVAVQWMISKYFARMKQRPYQITTQLWISSLISWLHFPSKQRNVR